MECGAEDACDGKSQDWKATPIPGKAETYMFASAASSAFCINAVSDPSGERARRHWRDVSEHEMSESRPCLTVLSRV